MLSQYNRLLLGFSGGLDSSVLLHQLSQDPLLHKKLMVIHVNHGLSAFAHAWQEHCQQICQQYNVDYMHYAVDFDRTCNIEENARIARFALFESLIGDNDALLLAQHVDDQAETILLQLIRGAGIDGLSAMPECAPFGTGWVVRPLLDKSRLELEEYAKLYNLRWIEDESNQNTAFSRNYLRQNIMPLLRQKWPSFANNLACSAKHMQQAQVNLNFLAHTDCNSLNAPLLSCQLLKSLPYARLVNVLRHWLKQNQVKMPSTRQLEVLIYKVIFTRQDATPHVRFGNVSIHKYQDNLYIIPYVAKKLWQDDVEWKSFPQNLLLDDGLELVTRPVDVGLQVADGAVLKVRTRRGGEKIRLRGQTKLLKNLFQEWKIPPWQRDTILLVYIDDILAAVVGYAISDEYYGVNGYLIEEKRDPGRLV